MLQRMPSRGVVDGDRAREADDPGLAGRVGVRGEVRVAADQAETEETLTIAPPPAARSSGSRAGSRGRRPSGSSRAWRPTPPRRILDGPVAEAAPAHPAAFTSTSRRSRPARPRATSSARVRSACSRSMPTTSAPALPRPRDRAADPAGRAGDRRDLARKLVHRRIHTPAPWGGRAGRAGERGPDLRGAMSRRPSTSWACRWSR